MGRIEFLFAMASFILSVHGLTGNTSITEITPTQSLKDGQLLLSPNGIFTLGFFNPGHNSNRYLGFWYKSINHTIVWVANRGSPITNSTGVLTLSSNGVLHLKDGIGEDHWFTSSQTVKTPKAFLLDSGNLVVIDTSSNTQWWQSFDQPCDSLLPGMKMGYDSAFSHERYLQSWKDENDPTPGDYIHKLDLTRRNELVILFNETVLKYRSGPWNGMNLNGMPEMKQVTGLRFNLTSNQYQKLYWYETNDTSNLWRLVMSYDGFVYRWHNSSSEWVLYWQVPMDICGNYARCGPYGICSSNDCKCLTGFKPESESQWEIRNFSGGCVRIDPLGYSQQDGFFKVSHVKLPDTFNATTYPNNEDLENCKSLCMSNYSCMGYTVMGFNGCVIWAGDLVDIMQFTSGSEDLYIRINVSSIHESKAKPATSINLKTILYIVVPITFTCVLFLLLLLGIMFWKKRPVTPTGTTSTHNVQDDEQMFEFDTLRAATNDFAEHHWLGAGQFGPVYKGVLGNGDEIAVKRLSRSSNQGIEQLKNEVTLLAKLKHINLVKLLGFCIQQQEMLLCYEYLPNGSLDQLLFGDDSNTSSQLEWKKRYKIIESISWGLSYLHEDNGTPIIHRDIKPSNILLDKNMVPKISDFGLARLFEDDASFIRVSTIAGTCGYIAPETQHCILSTKADVYSFGVLILETITGQRNTSASFLSGLVSHMFQLRKEGRVLEVKDPKLGDSCPQDEIERCIDIALLCLVEQPELRPQMREIHNMLSSKSFRLPDLPASPSSWGLSHHFGSIN